MTRGPDGSMRGPMLMGAGALLVLVLGVGFWAFGTRIAGAVIAPGLIEVEQQRQILQHPEGGVVTEIRIHEGSAVTAGEVLIRLDGTLLRSELAIVEGQYHEILTRRARLEAERDDLDRIAFPAALRDAGDNPALQDQMRGQQRLFDTRRAAYRQALQRLAIQDRQIAAQLDGIAAQQTALERQATLIAQELQDQNALYAKGLAQAPRLRALERETAALDGRRAELRAAGAQAAARRTEIDIARRQAGSERREQAEAELHDLGYRAQELDQRRQALRNQLARLDLRAPASGIVYQLRVTTPGAVIRPAEPILQIVPQDRPLVITARIAPIHIDEVHPGQDVKLRFAAFDARQIPAITGALRQVSADAMVDDATHLPYYRAEISIPSGSGDLPLLPGMPVEVYIQTGERSPAAYLLKPFSTYFNRAFREG